MASIRERLANYVARNTTNPENPSVPLAAIAKWLNAGSQTVAGESINELIALQITTVFTCVRVLSESVASLPCILFEKTPTGRKEAINHPNHYILAQQPNDEMSSFTFWEAMTAGVSLTGNSYAEIKWTKDGQNIGELYPLNPLMTEPFRQLGGDLVYRTKQGVLNETSQWRYIKPEDILHFSLFSLDGIRGLSPVSQARQSLGLTRAAEKFGARLFGNGSKPGGVLVGPEKTDEKMLALAKASWEAAQGGSNQGRTAVMPGEWKYTQIGLSPEDSQFLATRAFQRADIAAMYRVPSHMAGDTSKISNSSYEQMNLSFVNDTIRPILARFEAELNRKLVHQIGRKAGQYFVKFDLSERLRADHETTMKGVALGRQWGLITGNEGRIALGMNSLDDPAADTLLVPVNMMNADLIPKQTEVPNGGTGSGAPTEQSPTTPKGATVPSDKDPVDEEVPQLED